MDKKERRFYILVIFLGVIFLVFLIILVILKQVEIWVLFYPFLLLFIVAFIFLILYQLRSKFKKESSEVKVKKFKGNMTLEQFKNFIYNIIFLERGFNYKGDFDIIVGYLGKDIRLKKDKDEKESNEERITRIPTFETTLEHKYTNEKIFILINRINPEDVVILKNPMPNQIKETKDNFAFGKEKTSKKIVTIKEPLTERVQEIITDEPEKYTEEV